MKRLKTRLLSVVMSLTIALTMIPNNVFSQGETSVSNEDVVSSEKLDFVETTTPTSIELRGAENNRTFDIQEIDYRRSSMNPGIRYESKWEGIVPYGPLFGHMVNNGKYTRPLGKENADLGWGWGSSEYMTGYLLVDIAKFGYKGTEGLKKDEYELAKIGIVRVDKKYSRNNDFSSWKESIEEAFKEYNGNEGFTKKGYAGANAYQETKLVIWDGYKRERDISSISRKEYIKNVVDIDAKNTTKRQEIAKYIKKHLDNGAKLQGYITTDYGLKDVYEPSESTYKTGEKQIRYVPHIKITGVTYDVELKYENAPSGVELPKIVSVDAENKLDLKKLQGYVSIYFDEQGNRIYNDPIINSNRIITVKYLNLEDMTDTDNDGLFDCLEEFFNTSKNNEDSDNDGIPDSLEVFSSMFDCFNPIMADSDSNGINDGDEDFDGDGLTNKEEIDYKTDLFNRDTDADGLEDGEEIKNLRSNPLKVDTDGDGLEDSKEIEFGFDPIIANDKFNIEKVSLQRSKLGAIQNRLEHTIKNLDNAAENTQAAESRIRDTNMAKEMSTFTKNNVLSQAAQAMISQANQIPQQALQLLR